MAVIAKTAGKDYSAWAMFRRVVAQCFEGESNNAAQAPLALNNEAILAVNAAGTGTVELIKANAANITEITNTNGLIIDGPVTFAGGAAFSESIPVVNITTAGAATYTAAQIDNTIITRDCNGASRSDVTPTAALIVAAIPGAVVGSAMMFRILNISASDLTLTLTAGSGVTLKPTVITIPRLQMHGFIAVCTNVTAASEAVTVYSMLENGLRLIDAGGLAVLDLTGVASAVNNVAVTNAAASAAPIISPVGSDAAIGLVVQGKSTGVISFKSAVTATGATNYIASETGGNNAIVGALTDANGANVTVAAGLKVAIKLGHSLQAGANTFNLNGHGTDAVKSHNNPANNLGTAYVSGSIVEMVFDGTVWQDLSQ